MRQGNIPGKTQGKTSGRLLKYIRHIGTYFGASLIPMLLNLVANPWIAKNMSPEDYAITGYYTSFTSLIGPVIMFYLAHYYIKEYFRLSPEERDYLFGVIGRALIWFSAIVSLVCLLGIYIYIRFIADDFSLPISPYLYLSVLAIPLTGLLNLKLADLRIKKDSKSFFILSVSNGVLLILLSLLMVVWIKWGAFGKLLSVLIGNGAIFLYLLITMGKRLNVKVRKGTYSIIFKFCLPLTLGAMLGYFTTGFSTTYLESIGDNTEYGIYVVGVSIGTYLSTFSSAIGTTFQPDIYETTIKKDWRRFMGFCTLQLGLIGVVVIIFIICAPFIISILTAGRYVDSTVYAQIIAISTFTRSIYFLINDYSIATGRPKVYLYTTIIGSVGIVLAMPWATEHFQYVGGCWVSVGSFIFFGIINLLLLRLPVFNTPSATK
ncbi:MAG: oligosaccharide flippase family protein [Muribaculaceae bacterium]|nr:oligosaccharide flippase family protein [Muribaculaceae bacterium]